MEREVDKLLAHIMSLPPDVRERLVGRLTSSVREAAAVYGTTSSNVDAESENGVSGMTSLMVVLPDDLAKQAQAAGLLGERQLAELIRAALKDQTAQTPGDAAPGRSGYDVIKHLLGRHRGGSKDLSTNPDHLKDYGK